MVLISTIDSNSCGLKKKKKHQSITFWLTLSIELTGSTEPTPSWENVTRLAAIGTSSSFCVCFDTISGIGIITGSFETVSRFILWLFLACAILSVPIESDQCALVNNSYPPLAYFPVGSMFPVLARGRPERAGARRGKSCSAVSFIFPPLARMWSIGSGSLPEAPSVAERASKGDLGSELLCTAVPRHRQE